MRAALAALVASVAAAATAAAPRRQPLTLKVLAQRRPAELSIAPTPMAWTLMDLRSKPPARR